jgi:hypothetical protein
MLVIRSPPAPAATIAAAAPPVSVFSPTSAAGPSADRLPGKHPAAGADLEAAPASGPVAIGCSAAAPDSKLQEGLLAGHGKVSLPAVVLELGGER